MCCVLLWAKLLSKTLLSYSTWQHTHTHTHIQTRMPFDQNASIRAHIMCAVQNTGHGLYDFILTKQNFELDFIFTSVLEQTFIGFGILSTVVHSEGEGKRRTKTYLLFLATFFSVCNHCFSNLLLVQHHLFYLKWHLHCMIQASGSEEWCS